MLINDKVYGDFNIDSKLFIDLINSNSFQRLKGISQQGMPQELYYKEVFSRFDHSIGVFLLLKKLGASEEEQVAGLLHDISHTAFSHLIDWVLGDPEKEDYQDNTFLEVLMNSEIPKILNKYKIDIKKISYLDNFKLLERDSPSLCADRIDYTLRDLITLGFNDEVNLIINDLSVKNDQIVFLSKEIAEIFSKKYILMQNEHWAGVKSRSRYHILSSVLKVALKENELSVKDFNKTDAEVLQILSKSKNKYILSGLKKLRNGFSFVESNDEDSVELKPKFRYIDPEVFFNGEVKRLSSISNSYKNLINEELKNSKNFISIKIN